MLKRVLLAVFASATLFTLRASRRRRSRPRPRRRRRSTTATAETWLCRPGRQDACAIDLTTTVVAPDGTVHAGNVDGGSEGADRLLLRLPDGLDRHRRQQRHDRRSAELNVIANQFARFASKCRPYAPLYRQVTLAGLRADDGEGRAGARPGHRLQGRARRHGTTTSSTTTRDGASCWSATRRDRSSSRS